MPQDLAVPKISKNEFTMLSKSAESRFVDSEVCRAQPGKRKHIKILRAISDSLLPGFVDTDGYLLEIFHLDHLLHLLLLLLISSIIALSCLLFFCFLLLFLWNLNLLDWCIRIDTQLLGHEPVYAVHKG